MNESMEYRRFANQNLPRVVEEMNSTDKFDESTLKSQLNFHSGGRANERNHLMSIKSSD